MSTDKYTHDDSKKGIVKSTTILSLGTLVSRILGFIRDIIIAKLLGTASGADAFFVAFRIPNLFRDLVGEGATNSALIPVISEYEAKKDKMELWYFTSVIFVLSFIALSLLTILGIVFAPLIVRIIAPGFIIEPEKLILTVRLTRIMFPYLIFIGLTAYMMGILYTFRSFVLPAFSPCLLNITMIMSAVIASRRGHDPVLYLAIGVLAGGVAQFLVQIRPLMKRGLRFYFPKTLSHPGARKVGSLLLPRLFGSAIYQLNIFVDTFCASLSTVVGAGGIAAVYYSNRIVQFPMGTISVALALAILPSMAGFAARKNIEDLRAILVFSLKNIFLIMLPISIFLILFSVPLTRIFFERGEFTPYSTRITSSALLFYAMGLVSFGAAKIMVTAFHSMQDTSTPARVGFLCFVINAVLNFILMWPLKVGGIALASSVASTVNFLALFYILNKKLGGIKEGILPYFFKVALAAAVMGILLWGAWRYFVVWPEISRLLVIIILGFFIFVAMCVMLDIQQVKEIWSWILRRK